MPLKELSFKGIFYRSLFMKLLSIKKYIYKQIDKSNIPTLITNKPIPDQLPMINDRRKMNPKKIRVSLDAFLLSFIRSILIPNTNILAEKPIPIGIRISIPLFKSFQYNKFLLNTKDIKYNNSYYLSFPK